MQIKCHKIIISKISFKIIFKSIKKNNGEYNSKAIFKMGGW